ncbi:hypothetical protein [Enterococcus faecalis]
MVPKPIDLGLSYLPSFRVMLFRMVPKPIDLGLSYLPSFRVMLFRMVPKPKLVRLLKN